MDKNKNLSWLDTIRAIATLCVIILHVAAIPVLNSFGKTQDSLWNHWQVGNLFNSFTRFCVPAFVMLSGALLLKGKVEWVEFLGKRVKRIFLPFLFWSCIYATIHLFSKVRSESEMSIWQSSEFYALKLLFGANYHLWYVYMLLGLYLFIPILSPWVNRAEKKELHLFLTIWIILVIANQFGAVGPLKELHYFSGYIGYLVLGHYVTKYVVPSKKVMIVGSILFVSGYCITLLATYFYSLREGSFSSDWYQYLTFNVALMASGFFLFVKSMSFNRPIKPLVWARDIISKYSFGVYLVHALVLAVLSFVGIDYQLINPVVGICLTSFICLVVSLISIIILKRLPFGRHISG